MLTKRMKECAEYYALTGIAKEDVEYLCKCKWEELPKEFFDHVDKTIKDYNDWCNRMSEEIDEQINEAQYLHE